MFKAVAKPAWRAADAPLAFEQFAYGPGGAYQPADQRCSATLGPDGPRRSQRLRADVWPESVGSVLVNVLPGLRDLRAPLAAGYVWLLAIYVAFQPLIPSRVEATGVWDSLLDLGGTVSVFGVAVAISFVAYLVGSISEAARDAVVAPLAKLLAPAPPFSDSEDPLSELVIASPAPFSQTSIFAIDELVQERLREIDDHLRRIADTTMDEVLSRRGDVPDLIRRAIPDLHGFEGPEPPPSPRRLVMSRLLQELDLMRTNLLGKESELYSAIDRKRSEAEFRAALALPLGSLAAAFAWRATWWAAVLVVGAAVVLVLQGVRRQRESNDALIEALRLKRAKAPSLQRLDALINGLRDVTPDQVRQNLDQAARIISSADADPPEVQPSEP